MTSSILVLDIAGNPTDWIEPQEAVLYYAAQKVVWELGQRELVFREGIHVPAFNRASWCVPSLRLPARASSPMLTLRLRWGRRIISYSSAIAIPVRIAASAIRTGSYRATTSCRAREAVPIPG